MRVDDMLSQYQNEPFPEELEGDMDLMVDDMDLMGYCEPELMGGLIKKLIKKIKKRIKAKKIKGKSSGNYSISTPSGTVSIGPQGVNVLRPAGMVTPGMQQISPSMVPATTIQRGGLLDTFKENPAMLAIPAAALLFIAMSKKQKSK